jgi:hypothetical protein
VTDPETGERIRPKTFFEQTGRRKPYKRSKKVQQQIEWRRNMLSQLLVRGYSLSDASRIMHIPLSTLSDDQRYMVQEARDNMRNHISELPYNISQAIQGLNKCISMLYDIHDLRMAQAQGRRPPSEHVRVLAIGLIKDCIKEKMEILTNQINQSQQMTSSHASSTNIWPY